MEPTRHLEILRHEGALVAAVEPEHLADPVPALEGWDVERTIRHLGKVHRWVTAALQLPPDAGMDAIGEVPALPKGPAAIEAYGEVVAALVDEFERRDPAAPVATFVGHGTVGWWLRRQAHELVIHRFDIDDAVHGAGGPPPTAIAVDAAADGIDEWARVFLATRWSQRFGALPSDLIGRSVHLHGTDEPTADDGEEWLLRFGDDGVEVTASHAKGDVAMRGPAAELLLVLWRRRPLDGLDVIGDRAVAERVLDIARF
jgi:uncharacterized protein (TIGR03083 family)